MPKVESFDDLNNNLLVHCIKYLQHSIKGKIGSVGENFEVEKSVLLPLPLYHYVPEKISYSRVNSYSLIIFQTNKYSIPTEYCSKAVCLKIDAMKIEVYYRNNSIAFHERHFGKNQKIYDIKHYIKLLDPNPVQRSMLHQSDNIYRRKFFCR